MHRSSRPSSCRGPGPLALALLLALAAAGCGAAVAEPDDAQACEGLSCTAGTCVSNAGQPMCRCGPWEQAAGVMCEVAVFVGTDDHGGSPEEATPLAVTPRWSSEQGLEPGLELAEGRISASPRGLFDRDLFTFTAEAGHTYIFVCERESLPDCHTRLLDGTGRERGGFPVDARRTAMLYRALEPGPWYLEVSGAGDTGTYAYQLLDMGPDDFGDHPGGAALKEPSERSFTVRSLYLGDDDVLRFQAVAGHAYRLGCSLTKLDSGVAVRLLEPSGRVVAAAEGLGTRGPPEVELKATTDQPWFMQVSPTHGQLPLTFDCWLRDLGRDDHADAEGNATAVTPGVPFTARMHSHKDVDVVAFAAKAGHSYRLHQQPAGSLKFDLVAPRGGYLPYGNDQRYVIPGSQGTYFLKFTPAKSASTDAPVQLVLEDLGPDDFGSSVDSSTPAAVGTDIVGRFHSARDVDALAFPVEANGVYRVTCQPVCNMSAYNGHDQQLVSSARLGSMMFHVIGGAHLKLLISAADDGEAFTLRVDRVDTEVTR
ncbi:hypothetical protein [Pyxidicoccus xibeiensis]|uniref:hypothetical protein n=1 Tax=Pyxidicoccus xibeiensis TaxID=2906759 RepID=UPI0020A800CA|nr:hypothetical protein [Pyxidicoccus xibeiensis]MCP3140136.1 hypothetical protein [Pyxidicoccus xibeiensis]